MRVVAQEAKVVCRAVKVLRAADSGQHLRVERLQADFQLQRARGKMRENLTQWVRKTIRKHFQVEENAGICRQALKEECQDGNGVRDVEIE